MVNNHRGLFTWDGWDGQVWTTELLKYYRVEQFVQLVARARLNYEAVKQRLIGEVPREVNKFLLAYYHAEWEVHDRPLPFLRTISDTAMIHFLMKTAPSGIFKDLAAKSATLDVHRYAVWNDVIDLRGLQLIAAHFPYNPLYSDIRAASYKLRQERHFLITKRQKYFKLERMEHKASAGYMPDWRTFNDEFGAKRTSGFSWAQYKKDVLESRCRQRQLGFAEPLWSAILSTLTSHKSAMRDVQRQRQLFMQIHSSRGWGKTQQIIHACHQCVDSSTALAYELSALRYFRV
jgi:hypothetical protein